MPEFEVTADKSRSIREWANKNGRQIVSGAIDSIGSLNIVDGDPLLVMDKGFRNIEGVVTKVSAVLTSGEIVDRLANDGLIELPTATADEVRMVASADPD